MALNCYPDRLEYIDRIMGTTKLKLLEYQKQAVNVVNLGETKSLLLALLQGPINVYKHNLLKILRYPSGKSSQSVSGYSKSAYLGGNYTELLYLQPYGVRRQLAHLVVKMALSAGVEGIFSISTVDGVNFLLGEVCSIMIRDQIDGNLFGSKASRNVQDNDFKDECELPIEWDEVYEEQFMMAQLIHLIQSPNRNPKEDFSVLYVLLSYSVLQQLT